MSGHLDRNGEETTKWESTQEPDRVSDERRTSAGRRRKVTESDLDKASSPVPHLFPSAFSFPPRRVSSLSLPASTAKRDDSPALCSTTVPGWFRRGERGIERRFVFLSVEQFPMGKTRHLFIQRTKGSAVRSISRSWYPCVVIAHWWGDNGG